MLEEIQQEYKAYRTSLTDYIQSILNTMAGIRFEEPEYISFIFPDIDCMDDLELRGIDPEGDIVGVFEYPDGEKEEDVHLDMFTIEQLIDLVEILENYEITLGNTK